MTSWKRNFAVLIFIGLLGAFAFWWFGRHDVAAPAAMNATTPKAETAPEHERLVLYWYDPMRPEVHFDKPGQSPFMDMALVPKYAGKGDAGTQDAEAPAIEIDARMMQKLGMRTARVERGKFWQRVDTTGAVVIDESRVQVVESRVTGWVRQLHVRTVDAPVRAGDAVMSVYAPDLLAAQEELLIAKRSGDDSLLSATQDRLAFLDMPVAQQKSVLARGKAQEGVMLTAPESGVLTELNVREGSQVVPGMVLARIAALDRVWVTVDIPEAQAGWFRADRPAELQVPAFPQRTFEAKVDYLYPQLDSATRTLKARLVIDNRDGALRPGMYATVTLYGGPRNDVLLVPDEAVIRSGKRNLVMVAESAGRVRPVVVTAGAQRNGMTVIESGLEEGMQVVVSGQFLLESEANLQGALQRLESGEPDEAGMNMEGMP